MRKTFHKNNFIVYVLLFSLVEVILDLIFILLQKNGPTSISLGSKKNMFVDQSVAMTFLIFFYCVESDTHHEFVSLITRYLQPQLYRI